MLCAHDREVSKEKLSNFLPELNKPLADDRGEYVIAAYVQGDFLDRSVNQERTEIKFDEEDVSIFGTVTKKRLFEAIIGTIEAFAKSEISLARQEKLAQIQKHVETVGPEYGPLLRPAHAELIKDVPCGLTPEKLDAELHQRLYILESKTQKEATQLRAALAKDPAKYVELSAQYKEFLSTQNEIGRAKLADYVVHRRVILDLFETAISRRDDGSYPLEETYTILLCHYEKTLPSFLMPI